MWAGARQAFEKIGERGKLRIALATVVKRAVAQKDELGAVIAEFIDLRMINFDDPNVLRRAEEPEAPCAQTAVGCQGGMRRKPAREMVDALMAWP
jgi:hypothetical protein